jgi:hypothetical protein
MRAPSHAKGAKDCNEENGVLFTHVIAGPLGDLGALRVTHALSHAKNAKGAKDGAEEE